MLRYSIERKDPEWTKFLDLDITGMCTQIVLGHAASRLRAIRLMVIYNENVTGADRMWHCAWTVRVCDMQFIVSLSTRFATYLLAFPESRIILKGVLLSVS